MDPFTLEGLSLEETKCEGDKIIEGYLHSSSNSFPIVNGIPRFIHAGTATLYTESFGFQWLRWSKVQYESNNQGLPMQGHTANMFNRIVAVNLQEFSDNLFVDFGCGSGRFLELVSRNGGTAIGIDSSAAVEAAGKEFENDSNVLVVQADILACPVKNDTADFSYSIGVLHHTPNYQEGIREMSRITKPQGKVAVSVYGPDGYYTNYTVGLYRKIFKKLRPLFGYKPAIAYSYLSVILTRPLRRFYRLEKLLRPLLFYFPCIQLPDIHWSILDTFDSLTPDYQQGIGYFQIYNCLSQNFIEDIRPSDWGGTSMHGIKN